MKKCRNCWNYHIPLKDATFNMFDGICMKDKKRMNADKCKYYKRYWLKDVAGICAIILVIALPLMVIYLCN